jgi:dihydropteroate synthase
MSRGAATESQATEVGHLGRASSWQLRTRRLELGRRPLVMGILNVTPDSFSDGGRFFSQQLAIDQALRMEDEGADILDVGGESTRPYSQEVDAEEELRRIEPVLEAIVGRLSIPVSIDTSKASVAAAAIQRGAEIINDVTGLERDPAMIELARASGAGVCAMHMRGTPQTMQDDPVYDDVVAEIFQYLRSRDETLVAAGLDPARICLDPGIGFGKTHEHNLTLVRGVAAFHALGRPLLVGHSRKGFIGKLLGDKSLDRDAGTAGISLALAAAGVQVLRVHNVAMTRQALETFIATTSPR